MQTLSLALRQRGDDGEPLPVVFHQLQALGANARRGTVTIVAGPDAVGKSSFVSFWVRSLKDKGIYFSADADRMSFIRPAAAAALGTTVAAAEEMILQDDPRVKAALDSKAGHIWVCFNQSPTPEEVLQEVEAFGETNGEWPTWIVIDNLMDINTGEWGAAEHERHEEIVKFMKRLAGATGAAVFILQHVKGEHIDGSKPVPLSGLKNNTSKPARLVLSLFHYDDSAIGVSVVKSTTTPHKKDGSLYAVVPVVHEMAHYGTGSAE